MNECPSLKECDLLQKHLEEKVKNLEKLVNTKILNIETGILHAEKVLDAKMEKDNAVRQQLSEQNKEFNEKFNLMLPRTEYDIQHKNLTDKVHSMSEWKAGIDAKASINQFYIAIGIGLVGLLIAVIEMFVKH